MSFDLVVLGLGYVGLPLAREACKANLSTVGFDISGEVVSALMAGRSHVPDVSDADLAGMLAAGFSATTDPDVIGHAETVVICVPTGLSPQREPDLSAVRAAAETVGARVRAGTLVALESTSYPGTTEELVRPILERSSGLLVGDGLHLVYSPERIDPGNPRYGIRNTPKVVSGCTRLCVKHGVGFYGRFVDSLVVSRGTREAEMAKLLENTHRYLNIGLVNEVALFCDEVGIDVWDVLHCAATKPFGYTAFDPGPGVGGHCIPVDPCYLAAKARAEGFSFSLLDAAREVNERMPEHVVRRASDMLDEQGKSLQGSRVLLLGVTYKPDVADIRESPAFAVARILAARGAVVNYHDPHVPRFSVDGIDLPRALDYSAAMADADLTILMQHHSRYDPVSLAATGRSLLDTRGKVSGSRVTLL